MTAASRTVPPLCGLTGLDVGLSDNAYGAVLVTLRPLRLFKTRTKDPSLVPSVTRLDKSPLVIPLVTVRSKIRISDGSTPDISRFLVSLTVTVRLQDAIPNISAKLLLAATRKFLLVAFRRERPTNDCRYNYRWKKIVSDKTTGL